MRRGKSKNRQMEIKLKTQTKNRMKTLYTILLLSFSILVFGQNENPYSVFGYDAPIMKETHKELIQDGMSQFRITNTSDDSDVGSVTIDMIQRKVTLFSKEGGIIKTDTLYAYSLGRWLSVDPKNQFASPYVGMGNNPVMGIDPDGQFVFSALLPGVGIFIDAALWGAVIGGASYTASVAMSNGGFNNWNSGQFWKSVGMGAVSGVATAGVGSMFGPVGSSGFAGEIGRAMAHGHAQTFVGLAFGQKPTLGGYLTSFASSMAGSSFMMYGGKLANSTAGLYGFSGVTGGLTAELTGGNFWQGAATGLMNAGLNHAKANIDAAGARYFANKKAFYDHLWKNSFDENGNPIREVSGWELENGDAIALPYDKNSVSRSYNDALPVRGKAGNLNVEFKGNRYQVGTHAHTHPTVYDRFYFGESDIKLYNLVTRPIHILYRGNLYNAGMHGNRPWFSNLGPW
jgi:hypothetical protein